MSEAQIDWAECELAAYQRGFLMVRFDFVHNVLIWKDSNRWFNNFVRGLPREQMANYKAEMLSFLKILEDRGEVAPDLPTEYLWHISLGQKDEEPMYRFSGTDITGDDWHKLALMIEAAGGRSFKL